MYVDKDKQNSSMCDIKVKEETSGTSEKKEKARDGYVSIYEYGRKYYIHRMNACVHHKRQPDF